MIHVFPYIEAVDPNDSAPLVDRPWAIILDTTNPRRPDLVKAAPENVSIVIGGMCKYSNPIGVIRHNLLPAYRAAWDAAVELYHAVKTD